MALLVKMCNADVERFESATRFGIVPDSYELYLYGEDLSSDPVAAFHPSAWWAVFEVPPKNIPPAAEGQAYNLHFDAKSGDISRRRTA